MNKETKILSYGELNIQGQLGRGAFGTVYLAHCDEPEVTNPVVVKVMHESLVAMGDHAKKLLMKEAKLLSGLHHGNIVRMYGICENPLAIILEYVVFDFTPFNRKVKVNTLDKALSEIAQMPRSEEKQFDDLIPAIANDVTEGISHLHRLDVAHRDLKPANILISNQHYCALQDKQQMERIKAVRPVVCKLADFGESRSQLLQTSGWNNPNTKDIFRGTIPFMAPEILLPECSTARGKNLSLEDLKKIDIWALGMIFYCLINPGVSYPYEREAASDLPDIIRMVQQKRRPSSNPKYHAKHASVWSRVKDAFESCTNANASGRPKASDVFTVLNARRVPGRQDVSMRSKSWSVFRSREGEGVWRVKRGSEPLASYNSFCHFPTLS